MDYIKGNYRKSIFKSDQGYVIGLFKVRDTNSDSLKHHINKTITFTGYFHELNEDDLYLFYGEETTHPKYGVQFQVSEFERVKPEDKDGLIEFLSSDLFKGVGETLAKSIIETLGDKALELILDDASNLYQVPKLTEKKALKIHETLVKYEESHQIIIYLTELGFSMKDSLTIYNTYKNQTINIIETNIYKLVDDIKDISFIKVDEIGKNFDVEFNIRLSATIIYIMNKIIFENSDTYLEYYEIYEGVYKYLNTDVDDIAFKNAIEALKTQEKIVIKDKRYYLK